MPEFKNTIAVVIGINEYGNGIPPLGTAANDARALAQLLQDQHGYTVNLLLNEQATGSRITHFFADEFKPGSDDRVLFYFAGHGVAIDGDDGPNGYLLPQDARADDPATYIRMQWLSQALNDLSCRHLLVILDSCFGGAFRWSATRGMRSKPQVLHQERYDRFISDPAWQVITSASHDQKALDALSSDRFGKRGEKDGHSPFALSLFEALSGKADHASTDEQSLLEALARDGVITATELYLYLEEVLQKQTEAAGMRQTPRLWPLKKHDKGEYIFHVPGHELNLPAAPPLNYDNNPYRGLKPFEKEHAPLFFGRGAVVDALHRCVESQPLTVVLGASGTGKSSVVKAGLLPKLEQDVEKQWVVLPVIRPGNNPLANLARALGVVEPRVRGAGAIASGTSVENAEPIGAQRADAQEVTTRPPAGQAGGLQAAAVQAAATEESGSQAEILIDLIRTTAATRFEKAPGQRLLLVIDQFEELVTMTKNDDERNALLSLLATLLEQHPEQVRILITIRTDFEPQFNGTILKPWWMQGRYVVPALSREDLRAIIEEPASLKVLYFKPNSLVETLVDEVANTPGGLPLLSFALSEMYIRYVNRKSDDRSLSSEDYLALGGVVGALRSRADEEYEALDENHRNTMRRLMLRMVAVEGGNVARQRVRKSELEFPDPAETARVGEVIRRLTDARLLVTGQEENDESYVEPAHDALVRAWDKLIVWIRDEDGRQANLGFQQSMALAALEWERTAHPVAKAGLLWRDAARGGLLALLVGREDDHLDVAALTSWQRARRWVRSIIRRLRPDTSQTGSTTWMNRRELAFARRSIRRRRNIRLGLAVLGALILTGGVASTFFGVEAVQQTRKAVIERNKAQSNALVSSSSLTLLRQEYDTALRLAIQANKTVESVRTREALLRALQETPEYIFLPRPPPCDSCAASDPIIHVVDGFGPQGCNESVFSPDGKLQAFLGYELEVWDVTTEKVLFVNKENYGCGQGVAFSRDGHALASVGYYYGKLEERQWDIRKNESLFRDHSFADSSAILGIAVQPSGGLMAFVKSPDEVGHERLWLWRMQDEESTIDSTFVLEGTALRSAVFNGSASKAVIVDGSQIWMWDVIEEKLTKGPDLDEQSEDGDYYENDFSWLSEDGTLLARTRDYGANDLWDLRLGRRVDIPGMESIALGADGTLRVFANAGVSIHSVDRPDSAMQRVQLLESYDGLDGALSDDGSLLAFHEYMTDRTAPQFRVWDVDNQRLLFGPLARDLGHRIRFSPDNAFLIASDNFRGTITLWDVAGRADFGNTLVAGGILESLAMDETGTRIAAAVEDTTGRQYIREWRLDVSTMIERACGLVNRDFTQSEWEVYVGDGDVQPTCRHPEPRR